MQISSVGRHYSQIVRQMQQAAPTPPSAKSIKCEGEMEFPVDTAKIRPA